MNERGTPVSIAVIGPSAADGSLRALAFEAGRQLAEREAVVLVGGTGGVSKAAAEGARSSGGLVVGILPGGNRCGADEALTVAIPTGLGELSNGVLVGAAHAVLSIGGSWGTMIELAFAIRTQVPVVSLHGWQLQDSAGVPLADPASAGSLIDAVDRVYQAALSRLR